MSSQVPDRAAAGTYDMVIVESLVVVAILLQGVYILVNNNKNYKGLGTTEKEKKQEETQTGR